MTQKIECRKKNKMSNLFLLPLGTKKSFRYGNSTYINRGPELDRNGNQTGKFVYTRAKPIELNVSFLGYHFKFTLPKTPNLTFTSPSSNILITWRDSDPDAKRMTVTIPITSITLEIESIINKVGKENVLVSFKDSNLNTYRIQSVKKDDTTIQLLFFVESNTTIDQVKSKTLLLSLDNDTKTIEFTNIALDTIPLYGFQCTFSNVQNIESLKKNFEDCIASSKVPSINATLNGSAQMFEVESISEVSVNSPTIFIDTFIPDDYVQNLSSEQIEKFIDVPIEFSCNV